MDAAEIEPVAGQPAAQEIHRRAADEAGDEGIGRLGIELARRGDLLDLPWFSTVTRCPKVIASV
jgi:hypothetical protein